MDNERQKKQLQTQLNILRTDAEVLKTSISQKQKEYSQKLKAISDIENKIKSLNCNGELRLSEHALLRYFERVKGYDLTEIEKEIITDEVKRLVQTLGGSGKYPNNDFQLVVKDYTITTIVN